MTIKKAPQPFPRAEYLRRMAAIKKEMVRREIDALVVPSSSNITYLTENCARIFSLHALVRADKEEPALIVRVIDVSAFVYLTFLDAGHIIGYSDDYVGKADKNGYDAVIDFLHQEGLGNRMVGVEFNGSRGLIWGMMTIASAEKFKARLPNAVDCTRLRIVKSDLEIDVIRDAASIADAAILRAAEVPWSKRSRRRRRDRCGAKSAERRAASLLLGCSRLCERRPYGRTSHPLERG
ncbi:aminopeptidase P family N-terminal domain-containing protein [Bradyrhizobium diversitatis]|uniref:aminopeptidase P family N-terminal domain-containing protein n=1 Tax=Bradyrhizobium diversitatis TaxID=2755406 RepID=UPI001FE94F12|nr:aminopeptidase P family N-terminal domain-containing protein [Bradyrhizobium diversitatis]